MIESATPDPLTGSAAGSPTAPARWSGPTARRPSTTADIPDPPPTTTTEPTGWFRRHRRSFIVWFVVAAALAFRLLSSGGSGPDFTSLKVGDCLDLPDTATIAKLTTIDCNRPHTREVFAIGDTKTTIAISATGTQNLADPEIVRICRTDVSPTILTALAATADAQAGYLIAGSRTGRVACVVVTPSRTSSLIAEATGQ